MGYGTATPTVQDLFSRIMVEAFDEKDMIAVPTVGQAFFGNPANNSKTVYSPNSLTVDIDIIRGNERIAALVPRGTVSRHLGSLQKNTKVQQGTSFSRKYPLAIEEGDIGAEQLTQRLMGENPYSNTAKRERLLELAAQQVKENMKRLIRLGEVLAWQSLLTGKQDTIVGTTDTDLQYDFRRNTNHTFTVSTAWSNAAADILGDIDTACNLIRQNGHMRADMIFLGSTAMDGVMKNTAIKDQADNRRFMSISMLGGIEAVPARYQRFLDSGAQCRGKIVTPDGFELWVFTYIDVYTNSGGTATKYLTDDLALVASSEARADRYFGPSEILPSIPMRDMFYQQMFGVSPSAVPMPPNVKNSGIITPAAFYHDAYASNDWTRVSCRTQYAPIFATTMTDGFATIDVAP